MKIINKLLMCAISVISLGYSTSCNRGDKNLNIQILCTSDIHGMLVPYDYALDEPTTKGSLSQISTYINRYRNENTLLIDCGDILQGNSAEYFANIEPYKNKTHPMIEALNMLNYDVFVTGNHEYNFGIDYLKDQIKAFKGTTLTGNVFHTETGEPLADAYKIFDKNGIRVAVIGMTTHLIKKWDQEKLIDYTVEDPVKMTAKIAKKLKSTGQADVIIAAEHLGLPKENEEPGTSCRDLANECPEIDVILASHEHKAYEHEYVNGVLIVENAANAQSMMKVDLKLGYIKGEIKVLAKNSVKINVGNYKTDPIIDKFASPFDKILKEDARTEIGKLTNGPMVQKFEIDKVPATFMEPTALVNFINKVQLESAKKYLKNKEEVKYIKASSTAIGNYDANLSKENIRKCDVSHIYKYTNTLYVLKMNGLKLRKYLEWSFKFYQQYIDKDLTIAFDPKIPLFNYDMFNGIKYTIDISKPAGSETETRINSLTWDNGDPIDDSEEFNIAINNYRANTQLLTVGPIYKTKEELPILIESDINQGQGIREMIGDYIKENLKGTLDASEFKDDKDNPHWSIVGNAWEKVKHDNVVKEINAGHLDIGEHNTIKIRDTSI